MFAHPEDAPSDFVLVYYFYLLPVVVIDYLYIATGYFPFNIHNPINTVRLGKVYPYAIKIVTLFME